MSHVLSIAGSDPTGGAGIQRDVETILSLGLRPLTVVTTLTAQSPERVVKVQAVPYRMVEAQLQAVLSWVKPSAIKIGLAGSPATIDAIGRLLKDIKPKHLVIDPVIRASSGNHFLTRRGMERLLGLIPLATMVTPNIDEAEALTGIAIEDIGSLERAARSILSMGCGAVLIKGGHLEGDPVDRLFTAEGVELFRARRLGLDAGLLHGTGCILSCAIACYLALGRQPADAVRLAKGYLKGVLKRRAQRQSL